MIGILFISFLLSFNCFFGMEPEKSQPITIKDFYGKQFTIPQEEALMLGVIRKHSQFYEKDSSTTDISSKAINDDECVICLNLEPFFTKKNIKIVLQCIKDKKALEIYSDLVTIFLIADALEAPKKTLREISKYAWYTLPLEDINNAMYLYLTSIRDVYQKTATTLSQLNFTNKKIHILDGIDRLSNKHIKSIDLSNNRLREINIEKILILFPGLETLDVSENRLCRITLPYYLPNNFKLIARKNYIKDLRPFKANDECLVNFDYNPLSDESKNILLNALVPTYRQNFNRFLNKFKFSIMTNFLSFLRSLKYSLSIGAFGGATVAIIGSKKFEFETRNIFINGVWITAVVPAYSKLTDEEMHEMWKGLKICVPFGLCIGLLYSIYTQPPISIKYNPRIYKNSVVKF